MSAIIMHRIDPLKNMRRFYRLDVQRDLFGAWCLIREWGRIGRAGQVQTVPYPTAAEAHEALAAQRERKERRGHCAEFSRFLPELNKESDRGRVLISCSYLDELLRRVLLAFVIDRQSSLRLIDGFNAPLGTFSTRITATYALGLITLEEFNECETLRRIRNRFAHDVHASFDMQDIRDLCKNLTKSAQSYGDVVVDARGQYTTAAVAHSTTDQQPGLRFKKAAAAGKLARLISRWRGYAIKYMLDVHRTFRLSYVI